MRKRLFRDEIYKTKPKVESPSLQSSIELIYSRFQNKQRQCGDNSLDASSTFAETKGMVVVLNDTTDLQNNSKKDQVQEPLGSFDF